MTVWYAGLDGTQLFRVEENWNDVIIVIRRSSFGVFIVWDITFIAIVIKIRKFVPDFN